MGGLPLLRHMIAFSFKVLQLSVGVRSQYMSHMQFAHTGTDEPCKAPCSLVDFFDTFCVNTEAICY
jgi:hypothetical protein